MLSRADIRPDYVAGIGFDATCSLAVFDEQTNKPISVSGPDFDDHSRNVIRMSVSTPGVHAQIYYISTATYTDTFCAVPYRAVL